MAHFRYLIPIFAALASLFVAIPAQASTTSYMYVTGYSIDDNDPPGSKDIAYPNAQHFYAQGVGSYRDPVTVAVGLVNGVPQFKPGTRMYIPTYRKYFRVEDSCADCGRGHNGRKWIDVWVNGETSSVVSTEACMNKITGIHKVIVSPPNGYKVNYLGDLARRNACTPLYGETLVLGPKT
jgi:hypothetical protein